MSYKVTGNQENESTQHTSKLPTIQEETWAQRELEFFWKIPTGLTYKEKGRGRIQLGLGMGWAHECGFRKEA